MNRQAGRTRRRHRRRCPLLPLAAGGIAVFQAAAAAVLAVWEWPCKPVSRLNSFAVGQKRLPRCDTLATTPSFAVSNTQAIETIEES